MPLDWVPAFLARLRGAPNVAAASRAAGISRQAAYQYRAADPEFAAAWDDALEESIDALVGEMYRRAVEGVNKPHFYKGELCGAWVDADGNPVNHLAPGAKLVPWDVREYSDALAMFLARAHRPEVYGDRPPAPAADQTLADFVAEAERIAAEHEPDEPPDG